MKYNKKRTKAMKGRARILFRIYRISSLVLGTLAVAYLLLICFPQFLFAHPVNYGHFTVYSRETLDPNIEKVLDSAETRLQRSPIYDEHVSRPVFLTDSFGLYALLSHKAYLSFGNTVPLINNIIIDKSDGAHDLVFMNRPEHNSRSLSGVIAHEVTHLFIRQKYGQLTAMLMPNWKNEGYCEYVAGESTIGYAEGVSLWRARPDDDTVYRFFKYRMMVKYLLETEKMSLDDLLTQPLDEKETAAKTMANLD